LGWERGLGKEKGEGGKERLERIRTNAEVSVDRGISGSAGKVLVLSIRDMEVGLGVAVLLCEAEVDNVDLVASLADAHQEVVGLDIAVDEGLGVDVLDTRNELVRQEEDGLERELPVTEVEEILQTGAEEIEDHGVVVTLGSEPADEGDSNAASHRLVNASLILELGMLGLNALELDSNLLAGDDVGAKVDVAEGTGANLSTDPVLITDTEILVSRLVST